MDAIENKAGLSGSASVLKVKAGLADEHELATLMTQSGDPATAQQGAFFAAITGSIIALCDAMLPPAGHSDLAAAVAELETHTAANNAAALSAANTERSRLGLPMLGQDAFAKAAAPTPIAPAPTLADLQRQIAEMAGALSKLAPASPSQH